MRETIVLSNRQRVGINFPHSNLKSLSLAAALAGLLAAALPALAGNTWTGAGDPDGNWSNGVNWGGATPNYASTIFFGGSANLNATNDSATATVAAMTFSTNAGAFTLSGSSVTLGGNIVNNGTTPQTVNLPLVLSGTRQFNPSQGDLVFGGVISGAFNVIQAADVGTVTMNAAGSSFNIYQLNRGTTLLGVNDALPTSGGLTFATGAAATLDLNGKTQTIGPVIFGGPGTGTAAISDTAGGGLLKLASSVTQNASGVPTVAISAALDLNGATRTFNINNAAGSVTVSGPITNSTGTAGLTKNGAGTLILSGALNYNGDTTINGGTLQLDSASLNPNAAVATTNVAVLNLNFSVTNVVLAFSIDGVVQAPGVYNASSNPGLITGGGALRVLAPASTGIWDGDGANGNWSTAANWDNDSVPVFPKALTFVGPGQLTNTNDLVGVTANSITFDSAAGVFAISGNAVTLGGNISFNGDPSSPVTQTVNLDMDLGGANRTLFTQPNGNIVLGGVISGTNTLFKNNSGTLTLSGANNFAGGAVQVRSGTLKLGANEVIPAGLTLNPNGVTATLDLNGKTETLSATVALTFANSGGTEFVIDSAGGGLLKLEGNVHLNTNAGSAIISANVELADADGTQLFGVYDATSTLTVSGAITSASGTTNLVKAGVGTLILAGTNSYNCDTTVSGGTLQLDVACLSAANAVYLAETNGVVLNLNFPGTNIVSALYTNDVALPDGVYNAGNLTGLITGGGALKVAAAPAQTPGNLVNVTTAGGSLTFSITNSSGSYIIQATTNLALPGSWVGIATNTAPFSFTDTNAVNLFPRRFYRTVAQ